MWMRMISSKLESARNVSPATTLAETQALLARQGYYVGPVDGVTSPQFRAAAQAYLRDHPEAARGP
jgi:peptidoglycan hydrolase-like protein with peptidoglycan-binding domain